MRRSGVTKSAESVSYRGEQSLTPSGEAPNEVRRISIVRAILGIHVAVMREQICALRTETDGRRNPTQRIGAKAKTNQASGRNGGEHEEDCIFAHAGRGDLCLRCNDDFSPGKGKVNGKTLYLPDSHLPRPPLPPTFRHQRF